MPATTVVAVAAAASAGPFPERTAPTTPFTGEFCRVACCRVERLRGFAVLRLVVLFRLAVRPPDEDRLVRDCGFLLAISFAFLPCCERVPEPVAGKPLQTRPAITLPRAAASQCSGVETSD
jgi:hypothetical protein